MSKGQHHQARQPVSQVKGRETSQPRKPAGRGQPGGSSFIKQTTPPGRKPTFGTAPAGKPAPAQRDRNVKQDERAPFNRDNRNPQGAAPRTRDARNEERTPYNRDNRNPQGAAPRTRDARNEERTPYNRDNRNPQGAAPRTRDARNEERTPYNRDNRNPQGAAPRTRDARNEERTPYSRDNRNPQGAAPRTRDARSEERTPYNRDSRHQPGSAPRVRDGRTEEQAPFNRENRPQPGSAPRGRNARNEERAPSQPFTKVTRAKKMVLREPRQEIQDRSQRLRETRVDYSRIEPVRLQKALAQSGVGSRREMEEWIEAGLVMVNGKKATLGDKVVPQDRVTVKGDAIKLKWADRLPRVILYNKQEGEIVSRDDPQGRVTIFDRLPQAKSSRWVTIGRLDVNTSGLLIITTSGELANHMMHPSFEVEREYAVRILGELTDEQRREMCADIELEDGPARFERIIEQGGEGANHWYRVVIKEGRNREVRRLFDHFGLQVSRLIRVRFGNIGLPPRLKRGQFYELNEVEVAAVMKWSNLTMTGSDRR
jgi:23S rRNA pseudouridine2605 synthase